MCSRMQLLYDNKQCPSLKKGLSGDALLRPAMLLSPAAVA
jgi:hypothetical protein